MLLSSLFEHADVVAAGGAATTLFFSYRRDRKRERKQRDEFFSRCLTLFRTYRVTQDGLAYPRLRGEYRGYEVRLEPVVDDMAWRKIPSLWLKVTVLAPNPGMGVLDFLVRPRGAEFYSPANDLTYHMRAPADWPQDSLLYTDNPAAMPDPALLSPHMRLFDEPRMKELLITSKGVRLVRQISQADRAHYLVLRQAKFDVDAADPELVKMLLDAAIGIAESLRVHEPELLVA